MLTAVDVIKSGGVIAYPTEAVFGLGCDPDNQIAVKKLLAIKNRSVDKGLILLAGSFEQLAPYVNCQSLSSKKKADMLAQWPDGVTFILPTSDKTAEFISGQFDTVAVRVTSQPEVCQICQQLGKPIVSTSANLSGDEPARHWQDIPALLAEQLDYIVKADTLGFSQPSKIIDAQSGDVIRT